MNAKTYILSKNSDVMIIKIEKDIDRFQLNWSTIQLSHNLIFYQIRIQTDDQKIYIL